MTTVLAATALVSGALGTWLVDHSQSAPGAVAMAAAVITAFLAAVGERPTDREG